MFLTGFKNQGRTFPAWLDLRDPEAMRGTVRVRSVDPNFTVGLDTRRQVYQVWGPALELGGYVPIMEVQDDRGVPYRGLVPWELVQHAIRRGRESTTSAVDRVAEHNRQLTASRKADMENEHLEAAKYCEEAMVREFQGNSPWDARDVMDGYRSALTGSGKAEKRGLKVYDGQGLL